MARPIPASVSVASALTLALCSVFAHATPADTATAANSPSTTKKAVKVDEKITVVGTAEDQMKQSLGVSVITAEDIARNPPANDLADLIRRMPGVNLTGNSASGQYGNNRQIDIRGMGPENTLILIDGKPVSSRQSVRMGKSGERNSRGDTNWVPVEAVERIEVLRGPAAARYGSGAAGGVVNIITKRPSQKLHGSVSVYANEPKSDKEGSTRRADFNVAGGLSKDLSFRLYGNINRTNADSHDINAAYTTNGISPAGREGVRNKDINGLLRWDLSDNQVLEFESSFSRQGNIYTGEQEIASTKTGTTTQELGQEGAETNILYRATASVAHRGTWDWGNTNLIFSYEQTRNHRLDEGLAGGGEGTITDENAWSTSTYKTYMVTGSSDIPLRFWGMDQTATLGFELGQDKLDDPYATSQSLSAANAAELGINTSDRSGKISTDYYALYAEDNIELSLNWMLTPGVRFDHYDDFGGNVSPYISTSYNLTDDLSIHAGIAKAFKAPNLYQSNPNYLYYTKGNGCPSDYPSTGGGCYILGNDNLKQETSINKELGIEYHHQGWAASVAYFRNDYKNKIVAGDVPTGQLSSGAWVMQWDNASKALVKGVEGNLKVPLLGEAGKVLNWNTNVTYMGDNKNLDTDQPLSIIPRYTINSMLNWQATDDLAFNLTATRYGKQKPKTTTFTGAEATGDYLRVREPYNLFNVGGNYRFSQALRFGFGVTNLGDKRLYREATDGSQGANSYNEPGRAFYAKATYAF